MYNVNMNAVEHIKKDVIFSLRINKDLKRKLQILAEEDRRSLSAMINIILIDHVESEGK